MQDAIKHLLPESRKDSRSQRRYCLTRCTLRERGAKGKFVAQRGLTGTIFLPKRKKADFPKKYNFWGIGGVAYWSLPQALGRSP